MIFAAPALLAALALCLPVLVAFLVRRRRQIIRVPSTLLYRLAGAPAAKSRRFKHLQNLASLLACLAAVAALVVAAARPEGKSRGETVAYVVDVSASMGAGGRRSPLEEARRFLERATSGGRGDRYAVIAAGPEPVRLAGPTAPGTALTAAIEGLRAQRGAADLHAAIDLAASLVGNVAGARIVVLGDEGSGGDALASAREVPISWRIFPPRARENLGIAAFATRPSLDAEGEREVLITVSTSSDRPRSARVTLRADAHEIASRRVDVPARGDAEVRLRVLASVAHLAADVRPDDGIADALAADDEATLLTAAHPMPPVVLIAPDDASPAAFFVEKALAAAGARDVRRATPDGEHDFPPSAIAVVVGDAPSRRLDVPTLFLGPRSGALPFDGVRDLSSEDTHLRSLEAKDPLLRGVALDGITVERAVAAAVPQGARGLVELDGGTVMIAGGAGRGAWVFLGIDPKKSDLVLRVAFPVLVANAIEALGGASDVLVADTVARSEITLHGAPADAAARVTAAPQPVTEEPDPRFRIPLAPAALLALLGAALLAAEAWTFRKGWAS